MLIRVIEILFPMFAVVLVGYLCARKTAIDMGPVNKVNLDYFAPALVFASLVNMPLGAKQLELVWACCIAVLFPGLLMWGLCRLNRWDIKVWVPPHMFRNSGNLAIPLFVYTFGKAVMGDAVLMMVMSMCLQVTVGLFIMSGANRQGVKLLFKMPIIYATVLSLALNLSHVQVWAPLVEASRLLGESAIPLMLFSLGSQLIYLNRSGIRVGIISTVTSLITGGITFLLIWLIIPLPKIELQMMVLFSMLPPAVMNYLFAERYKIDPPKVAAMVLYGNFLALFTMPVLLWFALTVI